MAVSVSKQLVDATLRHLREGVPIYELGLNQKERDRVERVGYMLRKVAKQPETNVFDTFKRMAAGRYDTALDDWHAARKDKALYDMVVAENGKGNDEEEET